MFAYSRNLPEFAACDVLVAGAGCAGCAAAIAAARAGASVLLLDRNGFLGGTSTAVLDTFYGFYTPGARALKVVGGIPDEVAAALREAGMLLERPNTYGAGTGLTYHPDFLKVVWERLARRAGVRVLLHAVLQDAIVEHRRVTGVVAATKAGLVHIRCRAVVDASGDADLAHFAGAGYERAGESEPAQTLTTTFKLCNVDTARRRQVSREQFHELMAAAAGHLGYRLPRKEGSDHITPVPGVTATVMTRLPSAEIREGALAGATDPSFLTLAEMDGREQALEYVRFLRDRVPGYENAALAGFGSQIGVRETRRVHGDYRLTAGDVLAARQFDDQIGLCGAPIEDHHDGEGTRWRYLPEGRCVGIPWRTLIIRDLDNAAVAGRCFSATHDAHASVRSMGQCMAMGQAAGAGAALAALRRQPLRALPADDVRGPLRAWGAVLETPAA